MYKAFTCGNYHTVSARSCALPVEIHTVSTEVRAAEEGTDAQVRDVLWALSVHSLTASSDCQKFSRCRDTLSLDSKNSSSDQGLWILSSTVPALKFLLPEALEAAGWV